MIVSASVSVIVAVSVIDRAGDSDSVSGVARGSVIVSVSVIDCV